MKHLDVGVKIFLSFTLAAVLSFIFSYYRDRPTADEVSVKDKEMAIKDTPKKEPVKNIEPLTSPISNKVYYEILRTPNGGSGVFDFMYIACVKGKINHSQAQWLFNDLINKYGSKIAIDVWDNKHAFFEELKIYQKEDVIYDEGGDLRSFREERERVTAKYDKDNIAQYTFNGVELLTKFPEDNK